MIGCFIGMVSWSDICQIHIEFTLKQGLYVIIHQKREDAVPPVDPASMALEIGEQAVNKQLEIMQEQQKKAAEFVDKKVFQCLCIFVPVIFSGVHSRGGERGSGGHSSSGTFS